LTGGRLWRKQLFCKRPEPFNHEKNYENKVQNVQIVQNVQTPFFVSRC
jgi:hypothetical protein